MLIPHFKTFSFIANTVRAKEIAGVLVRRGFSDLLEVLGIPRQWTKSLRVEGTEQATIYERLRLTLEDLGPTYVKFGQILSSRPDLLPEPLVREFRKLRAQVKPVDFDQLRPLIENELGKSLADVFSEFDEQPLACGSIGQVYRAILKHGGQRVAVKAQRPGIRKSIRADIEILGWMARKLNDNIDELRPYDLPGIVAAIGEGLMQELDFTIEANNASLFNFLNPFPEQVFAPHVFEEYQHERLLVTEWVDGVAPHEVKFAAEQCRELAKMGARSVFHQIVITGFFHADPHGGNLLICPDGRGCFIDWGLAGQLSRTMRYELAELFEAISRLDSEKVARVASGMAPRKQRIDIVKLEKDVAFVMRQYGVKLQAGDDLGQIVLDLLYVFGNNGITLSRDYALLAKAVISIEEVARTLDPDFDLRNSAEPFLKQLHRERWNPLTLGKMTTLGLLNNLKHLRELPEDIQRILHHLEDGDLKLNLRIEAVEDAVDAVSSGANRLVLGTITAALIVGSSIIVGSTVDKETTLPELFRLPEVIGVGGFILGGFFGVWTIVDIMRHGSHKT